MRNKHTVFLEKETETGKEKYGAKLNSSIESKATCKNSADLHKNKEGPKFTWVGYALSPSIERLWANMTEGLQKPLSF